MKSKLRLFYLFFVILCLGSSGLVAAQVRVPGVKAEDKFSYGITAYWSSKTTSAPTSLKDYNNTLWYNFTVSSVSGSNVTASDLWHFVNGTQLSYSVIQDVASGASYQTAAAFQSVVAANLGVNDFFHPSGADGLMVNQTVSRAYASGLRDTNVVKIPSQTSNAGSNSQTVQTTYYFDKATGMLVESDYNVTYSNPLATGLLVWTLKDTNVWIVSGSASPTPSPTIPEYSSALVFLILIATTAGALFSKKKNTKHEQFS